MTQVCDVQQRFRGVLVGLLSVATLLAWASGVDAAIYEWVDNADDRHYVSSLDLVPAEARAKARLVVSETPPPAIADVSTSEAVADGSTSDSDEGDRGFDRSDASERFASSWDLGFRAGWEAGYRAGIEEQPVCLAQPPVIVLESSSPPIVNVPRYDPSGLYYRSPYQGTLTLPFDGGRSRGMTLRQLNED